MERENKNLFSRNLRILCKLLKTWLRGKDLNLRPLGYEPNELPGCSTPHLENNRRRICGQIAEALAHSIVPCIRNSVIVLQDSAVVLQNRPLFCKLKTCSNSRVVQQTWPAVSVASARLSCWDPRLTCGCVEVWLCANQSAAGRHGPTPAQRPRFQALR
jgi:hypothetical protein